MPMDLVSDPLNDQVLREIRREMAAQRLSQAELAALIGHSQWFVSYRLTGKKELTLSELEDIAGALRVPIRQLLPVEIPASRRRRVS